MLNFKNIIQEVDWTATKYIKFKKIFIQNILQKISKKN